MWITVTLLSYFLFAIVALIDKYLLATSIPNPKVYVFYVGTLSALVLVLAPFVGFFVPPLSQIALGILSGSSFVYGLFWYYKALSRFEASRIVPAVGALTPLFTFGLVFISSHGQEGFSYPEIVAFLFLILGSILIVAEKNKFINLKSLRPSLVSAFFLSLSFVFTKYLFLALPFWTGLIWKGVGAFAMSFLFFLIFSEIRKNIFGSIASFLKPKNSSQGERRAKPGAPVFIFLADQTMGAGATVLQNWAVALAPLLYVAFINAMQGVQYVFILIFSVILSLRLPRFLKETISEKILLQKIAAIFLIGVGLVILALN